MRKILFLFITILSVSLSAQEYYVSFGLLGGGAAFVPGGKVSPGAGADIDFTYLWTLDRTKLGIRTGLTGMYSTSSFETDVIDRFSIRDCYDLTLDYTIHTALSQHHRQFQLGIPVMLAGKVNGFVFAAGVQPMFPVWASASQDVSSLHTSVYYPEFDITVVDDPALGVASESQRHRSEKNVVPAFHLLCGLELGYEWTLGGGSRYRSALSHHIGVKAYCNIAAYSTPFRNAKSASPFVTVVEAPNEQSDAVLSVPIHAPSAARYMDFGIKLYYAFSAISARAYGLHR